MCQGPAHVGSALVHALAGRGQPEVTCTGPGGQQHAILPWSCLKKKKLNNFSFQAAQLFPRRSLQNIYENTKISSPQQGKIHNVCTVNKIPRHSEMSENT